MDDVYLLLGSNLGERERWLEQAREQISDQVGEIVKCSGLYETASWGIASQPDYINQVLLVKTELAPRMVLERALEIEKALGRRREEKWGSRIIDIDILFYGDKVIQEDGLTIPHPHLQQRRFVLVPLKEIAPELKHPVFKKTITSLYSDLTDTLSVRQIKS
jgi:2-amino-4-hydroxy-6-hydroxymethyldihydropteridine diphosphokinase